MRKLALLFAILGFVSASASAAPIQVGDQVLVNYGTPHYGSGGEFRLTAAPGYSFDAFDTFCVQTTEYINPDGTTRFEVVGISTSTAGNSPKALDSRAAWLYEQFSLGTLGANFSYSTSTHAGQLQRAIWHFMGEGGYDAANPFIAYFDTHTTAGIGNVRVLNLRYLNGSPAQDQLVYVTPVPEAGSFGLVLTGLAGLMFRMRRRR
jgi:hypothetical protein